MTSFRLIPTSILLLNLFCGLVCFAQTKDATNPTSIEDLKLIISVKEKIESFTNDLETLHVALSSAPADVYPDLLKKYNSLKLRWDTYYQSYQGFIADNDELMQCASDFGLADESIKLAMADLKSKLEAKISFENAIKFIENQENVYVDIYKKALSLSATSKFSSELAKLKGKEQLIFADIQKHYDEACAAVELIPVLAAPMENLEEKYIALKCLSEKIQKTEFKPFIQRAKDYLLGFATVAVILMFLTMLQSKWKAAKQMKENSKKMMEQYGKDKNDYPSI